MKVSKSVKLHPCSYMPDSSYFSVIKGKIEDPEGSANGRKKWKKVEIIVRVIPFQISGISSGSFDNNYNGSSYNGQRNRYPLSQTGGY